MTDATVRTASPSATQLTTTRTFLDFIFPDRRNFAIRLWDDTVLPAQDEARFTIVLNRPAALRRMFRLPLELSLAEAFIRNDFDVEGDIFSAFNPFYHLPASLSRPADVWQLLRLWARLPAGRGTAITRGPARLHRAQHSLTRDRQAIQYHYDVGNDFYALWLDECMVYSCAYFPAGNEGINTAQEKKLDLICRKLNLQPGERLLDIGCGWGGLVMYAAQHYGVAALGVTLSEQQQRLANERIAAAGLGERVTVKLQDYRALDEAPFDKLASVGMYEHVGRSHLPEYFAHARRLLKPGGLFLNHGIGVLTESSGRRSPWRWLLDRYILGAGQFVERYIFPDGELEPVHEVNQLAERSGFEVCHVENLRTHYARTLRHWVTRLAEQRNEALRIAGESVYRTWRLYMAVAAYGFESGNLNVNQSLLRRPTDGVLA